MANKLNSRLNFFHVTLPRVNIYTPFLSLGIREDKESELGIVPGKIILLKSSGTIELISLIHALLVTRTTLVDFEGKGREEKVRVHIVYPVNYPHASLVKQVSTHYLETRGIKGRLDVRYMPVNNDDDLFNTLKFIDDCDVYFDLYPEFYLNDTKKKKKYMEIVNEKKKGKIVMLNRFNALSKTMTENANDEVTIEATSFFPSCPDLLGDHPKLYGKFIGNVKLKKATDHLFTCSVLYPYTIR